jgi:hypothetical protein
MRYEIYLRMPEGADPPSPERIQEVLAGQGLTPAEGVLGQIDLGQGVLRAEEYADGEGDAKGVDFSFPLGLPDAEGDRALQIIMNVKEELTANLFDPQLGSLVARADLERILQSWREAHAFHFGVAGTPGLGAGEPSAPQKSSGMPARIKLVLILGIFILVAVFLFRTCFNRWMEKQMDQPPPVDGPLETYQENESRE